MTLQPILHHFEASPFSEKIRIIFGFKRIAWQSVLIPRIMPKPDLMPLTGGYRRTPVLQIGADIYCDTQTIIRELEARFPEPTLYPSGHAGLPWAVGAWSDKTLFWGTVSLVFGTIGDKVPQAFIEDRSKLRGVPFDVPAMAAALPHHKAQFRAAAALIEAQLTGVDAAGTGPWLLGAFSLADVSAYMTIWYVRTNLTQADELLAEFPRLRAWESRVRAIGHGTRTDIAAKEALAIVAAAEPATPRAGDDHDPSGLKVGDNAVVFSDEAVRTDVAGEIVSLSAQHVAIRRSDPKVGDVVVHFPRAGYVVEGR